MNFIVIYFIPLLLPSCVRTEFENQQKLKSGALFGLSPDYKGKSSSSLNDPNYSSSSGESFMLHEAQDNHWEEYTKKYPHDYPFYFDSDMKEVDFTDSYAVGQTICDQMKLGVTTFFSAAPDRSAENMLRSFSDRFLIPYISASHFIADSKTSYSGDMPEGYVPVAHEWSINIRPFFTKAVLALQKRLKWDKITYITDTIAGTSAVKDILSGHDLADFEIVIRKVETDSIVSHESTLKQLRDLGETRIMIDATVRGTFNFFNAAHGLQMLLPIYQYIVLNPAARDYQALKHFTKGGMNITALSIQQLNSQEKSRFVQKLNNASHPVNGTYAELPMLLAYDAVAVIRKAWQFVVEDRRNRSKGYYNSDCPSVPSKGPLCKLTEVNMKQDCMQPNERKPEVQQLMDLFMRALRSVRIPGVTGNIQFDERGYRTNLSLELHEISFMSEDKQIGKWSESREDFIIEQPTMGITAGSDVVSRHLIVTSIIEPPFLMIKPEEKDGEKHVGNERYEGYCMELAEMLAKDLGFTYEIKLVEDSQYGSLVAGTNGTWSGMIGEVMTGVADLAIAPLTINADRQRVVAFTKPFMNIGISIMIKRPQSKLPGPLSFLDPFSNDIWYGIIIAYCGVSLGLFLVARFSPIEWQDKVAYREVLSCPSPTRINQLKSSQSVNSVLSSGGAQTHTQAVYIKHNDFTLNNCMWFSLGALMQQGTDIAPKAPASRIVGGVWWFFTLIIISSYTANLAAFLTVERMVTPINNADELPNQREISYGTRSSGSTKQFFNNSQIDVFKRMWEYMSSATPSVFEPSNNAGIARVRNSNGKYAFLIESAMNEYIQQQKPCDTMKVGPNLDSKGYGIAAAHNSPWVKNITLKILKYQEDGALERLKTTWWVDKGECGGSFSSTSTDSTNSLGLSSVAGIFYILISGLALAMVSAVAEYVIKSWKNESGSGGASASAVDGVVGKSHNRVCYEPVACVSEMRDPKDLNSSFNPPNIPPPALSIMGGSNSVYGFVPPNIPLLNAHTGSVGPVHNNLATNIGFSLQPVPDGNAGVGGAGSLASGTDFNTNYATLYNTPFHSPFPGTPTGQSSQSATGFFPQPTGGVPSGSLAGPSSAPGFQLPLVPSPSPNYQCQTGMATGGERGVLGLGHGRTGHLKSRKSNHTDV
ncbi:glutamate receptor 2-like isoform X2 [Convolutriloba macropyga]|uniref:glutamate receptor 2-like isoform X2 n=1 Tax=Convolutriloba macropyga TaxID=536237 RepID=UPI003F51FE13